MSEHLGTVTNLELRTSNPDGTEGAGLSHTAEGLHLLHVYEMAGDGEPRGGVTIVHDLGEHGMRYVPLAEALVKAGWALALPDMRGHGASEGERGHCWGLPEPVRDIHSVQDHVAYRLPDHPKILIGVGVGALYALAYALEGLGAVNGLVLLAPVLEPKLTPPPAPGGLKAMFKKPKPLDPGVLGWSPEQRFVSPEARTAFASDPKVHDVVTRHTAEILPPAAASIRGRVEALDVPRLVLHGSEDQVESVGRSEGLEGPRGARVVIGGAGHGLMHEAQAPELTERIVAWCDAMCPR
ncbi:MAG: alpha/beta fold hydrolase [Planctomycetota bacterium]